LAGTGFSKKGELTEYYLKGRIAVNELLNRVTVEEYKEFVAYDLIAKYRYANKVSRDQGKLVKNCVVMDCKGVTTTLLRYLPYFKYEVDWPQMNCPELLGDCVVINTPWFFNVLWNIVKPWLDARTLSKVIIISGNDSETQLHNYIDEENIPTAIGGKNPAPNLIIPDPLKGLTQVDISAGSDYTSEISCQTANMAASWRFTVLAKDIYFTATFTSDEGEETVVVARKKVSASEGVQLGSYMSPVQGTLKLRWDNSHSYWTSKSLMFYVDDFKDPDVVSVAGSAQTKN